MPPLPAPSPSPLKRKRNPPQPASTTTTHSPPTTTASVPPNVKTTHPTTPPEHPPSPCPTSSSPSSILSPSSSAPSPDSAPASELDSDAASASERNTPSSPSLSGRSTPTLSSASPHGGAQLQPRARRQREEFPLKHRIASFLPLLRASNDELFAGRGRGGSAGFEIVGGAGDGDGDGDEMVGSRSRKSLRAVEGKKRRLVREVCGDGDGGAMAARGANGANEGDEVSSSCDGESADDDGGEGSEVQEPYIEMDLNLGVLEEVDADGGGSSSDDSAEDDEDVVDDRGAGDEKVLERLMDIDGRKRKRRKRDGKVEEKKGVVEVV